MNKIVKEEKTMHPYFSEWEPTGDGCYKTAANRTERKV